MHSPWGVLDSLMREIGALRNEARGLDPRLLNERITAELDRHIASAAQAVDDTIGQPESEEGILGACEAIVIARERIEALRLAVKRSGAIVERSVELRQQAARQLYDSIKARG